MEAMVCSLKPPTCSLVKGSQGLDSKEGKLYAKSHRPFHLRKGPSRKRLQVECFDRGLDEVKPLQGPELQEKFGSENLKFSNIAGKTVVELKMASGTSARLLLEDARITSYNCYLWHGSPEEFLHSDVEDRSGDTRQQFSVSGGMAPSLAYFLAPHLSLCNNDWAVKSVVVNPDEHIQVTLLCVNKNTDDCHFKLHNIITLSNQGLASALLLVNEDVKPLTFTASVSTHLAIRSTEAILCVGLDGREYFSSNEPARKVVHGNPRNSFFGKLKRFLLPFQQDKPEETKTFKGMNEVRKHHKGHSDDGGMHRFVEQAGELTSVTNGVRKIYSNPPNKMRVTDQGLRRSLLFENYGFENLVVSSPKSDGDKPFVSVAYSTVLSPITLNKGEYWKTAQLGPPTRVHLTRRLKVTTCVFIGRTAFLSGIR
ncbi:hypothetical protein L7F22_065662 [Adiantum nelumboides]|nr:hypothetical protein [Adiantum nelumboides]